MKPLVKSIPAFSEGQRQEIIDAIIEAITRSGGVYILDSQIDPDANRFDVTLVGLPEEVEKAVYAGVYRAMQLIDMGRHRGTHPRFGAADVISFMPIRDISLQDCVDLAHRFGNRIANELQIPVYFYDAAAIRADYQDLKQLQHQDFQYEQLTQQIGHDPIWMPDVGPAWMGTAGATLVGACLPTLACEVYLNTLDYNLITRITSAVHYADGGLHHVKAKSAVIDNRGLLQIEITNYQKTPLPRVLETIRREANRYGIQVTGTRLLGLIPQAALNDSASWYLQLVDNSTHQILEERITQAEDEQTLLAKDEPPIPDDATKHVTVLEESKSEKKNEPFNDGLEGYIKSVSNGTVTPGGGSVSALAGTLAAALAEMVASLTLGKKGYDVVEHNMRAVKVATKNIRRKLLAAVVTDVEAFENLMDAIRISSSDPKREEAIQQATLTATDVPFNAAKNAYEALQLCEQVAELGNHNAAIDAAVGAHMALAAIESAALNVQINLLGLNDRNLVQRYTDEIEKVIADARDLTPRIIAVATQRAGLTE